MDLAGTQRIEASQEEVWRALNDPDILRRCIPDCQELVQISPTEFTAKVLVKIGPVKATFAGTVMLSDLDPPNRYRISGEGKGGVAGFAKGGADVWLVEEEGATILNYAAQAKMGGKIAQLGARLIDGAVKKFAGEFFSAFGRALAPETEADAGAAS